MHLPLWFFRKCIQSGFFFQKYSASPRTKESDLCGLFTPRPKNKFFMQATGSLCRGCIFSGHALLDKGVLRIEGLDKILSSKAKRVAIVSRITCKHTFLCFVKHGSCYFTTSHQFVLFVALNVLSEQVWSMPRVSQEIVVPLASHAVCLLSCNTKVCSCA